VQHDQHDSDSPRQPDCEVDPVQHGRSVREIIRNRKGQGIYFGEVMYADTRFHALDQMTASQLFDELDCRDQGELQEEYVEWLADNHGIDDPEPECEGKLWRDFLWTRETWMFERLAY
jgi:hypothetical protein